MIRVYCPHDNIQREWIPRLRWPESIELLEHLGSTPSPDFQISWTWVDKSADVNSEITKLKRLAETCQLVFVMDAEIHERHPWVAATKDHKNLYWIGPGYLEINKDHWITWHDWLAHQASLYHDYPEKVSEFTAKPPTPLFFDVLLGNIKPHRNFIRWAINHHGIADKCVMGYDPNKQSDLRNTDDFTWEPGCIQLDDDPIIKPDKTVIYQGRHVLLGMVIPTNVYSRTCYSIVAETNYENHTFMVTEKTAKPILAKRPFVVFAGKGFLRFLRESGFQTFGSVIDESYDEIEDNKTRWNAAFDQVRWLCEQDQTEILSACKPVLEHNFHKIWNDDFKIPALAKIQGLIDKFYEKHIL